MKSFIIFKGVVLSGFMALTVPQVVLADIGADGSTYVLQTFDGTSLITGLNDQGRGIDGSYGSTTDFVIAKLDKCIPTDPCRIAAENYNGYVAVNDTVGFNAALSDMVTNSCKAKILIDTDGVSIKTFKPVP
jgi:hypothetical protein